MIRFGIIGCGRIAEKHAGSIAKCPDARLNAIWDPETARMSQLRQKYSRESGNRGATDIVLHDSPDDLLSSGGIDAVVVSSPSFTHAQWAKAALRAGKHVLLEKPVALSLRDADEIAELADKTGLCAQACHQLRCRPLLGLMKEWIDDGALGRIRMGSVSVWLNRSPAYYGAAPWRGSWERDGGMLLNQGVHLIDLLLWMVGQPAETVYGAIGWGESARQTEDAAAGTIRFTGGAIGSVAVNTLSQPDNLEQSLSIFGDRGTISVGGARLSEVRRWHSLDRPQPPPLQGDGDEHLIMYERFIDKLLRRARGPRAGTDIAESRHSLEAVFALYQSVRTGSPVRLPLTAFDTRLMSDMER